VIKEGYFRRLSFVMFIALEIFGQEMRELRQTACVEDSAADEFF